MAEKKADRSPPVEILSKQLQRVEGRDQTSVGTGPPGSPRRGIRTPTRVSRSGVLISMRCADTGS
jgi:hypothetical protein